jgi:hypothetical protein
LYFRRISRVFDPVVDLEGLTELNTASAENVVIAGLVAAFGRK